MNDTKTFDKSMFSEACSQIIEVRLKISDMWKYISYLERINKEQDNQIEDLMGDINRLVLKKGELLFAIEEYRKEIKRLKES